MVEQNGQPKTEEELKEQTWCNDEWYEKYPEEKFHYKYSDEVITNFKSAAVLIASAQVYMQRIHWLLSGDDGPESFLRRLDEDFLELGKIKKEIR